MKSKEYTQVVQKILHMMDEGIHVIDETSNTVIYNEAMSKLEKMEEKDVIKKPFTEVFKNFDLSNSTLLQALKLGKSTINEKQTYLNKDGKEITTINTTIPVIIDGKIVAAVEIAKNITKIQEMSHTILELQKEIEKPDKAKHTKIRKYNFNNIIGQSGKFMEVIERARKASNSSASVFIYGETGTGKELIAQSIHFDGIRKNKPFLAQNCAALPETLLEGLLFGTAKGGFTGAVDRAGLFEQANGGTLLLDEINSMPYELQAKLLRVLQENYIRRVGGTKDIPIDVRIITTSNERPEDMLTDGKIRKDLFYRLNIIPLYVPPLRERRDDILVLAEKFIDKYNERYNKKILIMSEKAKEKLLSYDYPGNVRELENIIMGGMAMAENEHVLTEAHLIMDEVSLPASERLSRKIGDVGIDKYLEDMEREIISHALNNNAGNITKTAEELKIKRQTLQHKLKKYGM